MESAENVTKTPYAEWLEGMIRTIMEHKPVRMGVCMVLENGEVFTGYYGEHSAEDMAVMAYHIQADSTWKLILANADQIVREAERMGEENEC